MKARLAAVVALALVPLVSSNGIAAASSPLPPLKLRNAHVTLCLSSAAQQAFTTNNLRLNAIAPSVYSTSPLGRSCVTFRVEGMSNLDVSNAHADLAGGFDIVDAQERHLTMTGMVARVRGFFIIGTAKLNDQTDDVEVLKVDLRKADITPHVLPLGVEGDLPVTLTNHLASAAEATFGASPLDSGAVMFDATGRADLGPPIPGLPQ